MEEYDWSPHLYVYHKTVSNNVNWEEYEIRWLCDHTIYCVYKGSRDFCIAWLNKHWKQIVDDKMDAVLLEEINDDK